jgi:hypothetical protein
MRLGQYALLSLFIYISSSAQQPANAPESLVDALNALPSQMETESKDPVKMTDDFVKFTNVLENQVTDLQANVAAALPILKQYLEGPNVELRRYALLTISQLARRPNSASELASILPAVYSHLYEQDIHLRATTVLAIETIRPEPPDQSIAALIGALGKTNVSDFYGPGLAESLVRIRPNDDDVQNAVIAYINKHKPGIDDSHKADVIEAIGGPQLGERTTQEIVHLAGTSPAGRLRNAAIIACAKIGPRAVSQIKDTLDAIKANPAETSDSLKAVHQALSVLNQK